MNGFNYPEYNLGNWADRLDPGDHDVMNEIPFQSELDAYLLELWLELEEKAWFGSG